MLFWLCIGVVITQAVFAVLSLRHFTALPVVPTVPRRTGMPRVSIIIPARNEASILGRLLASLINLDYGSYEVIVVDDDSSDATHYIAGEFDAILIRSGGPPPGWTGKAYACYLGALAATGDWLLFTDADTEHSPLSLASTMGYVADRRLAALSVLPSQELTTFTERLVLPFTYQQFYVGVPGARVNDPHSAATLASGQYMLIRRDAYERVGGYEAVRRSVVDDVRLAHLMRGRGIRYAIARAPQLVHASAYREGAEVWAGFRRISFQFLSLDPGRGALVMLSAVLAALTPALFALGLQPGGDAYMLMAGYSYAFLTLGLMSWDRLFHVPALFGLLQPLSVLAFGLVALTSGLRAMLGQGIGWKGRVYGGRRTAETTASEQPQSHQRPPQA